MGARRRSSLEIRPARGTERAQALEITLEAYTEYGKVLRPEYWQSYRDHIVETLADVGPAQQLLALWENVAVGTVLYYPPGTSFGDDVEAASVSLDCPEVRLLAVAPEGRGLGVGRALMEVGVARARESGAPGLVLHTMSIMESARALYSSMGFGRAPELDFQPAKEWFVEGFRLDFETD